MLLGAHCNDQLVLKVRKKRGTMRKPETANIYNLSPLLAGRVAEWERHLTRAAEMAVNWIFVNRIQCTGNSGGLHSIADYFDFNPLMIDAKSGRSAKESAK